MNRQAGETRARAASFFRKSRYSPASRSFSRKEAGRLVISPRGAPFAIQLKSSFGAKGSILRSLTRRGCRVTVLPHDTPAEDVLSLHPDGIMLSNGPGDPAENVYEIAQIRKLVGRVPVFGICLGHQLTALAMGGQTVKLKYGHRGGNQPARRLSDGRTFITSQNHGYAVVSESMAGIARLSWINANDQSCEGLDYPDKRCFTVQFHPEAHGGPRDTEFLFDRFLAMMGGDPNA